MSKLLALLGVDADHRLAGVTVVAGLVVDVAKLDVPIRVLGALAGLRGALQAEPGRAQQPTHRRRRHPMPLTGQLIGQVPQRLGRPPQRRLRIAALVRLDHPQQSRR
jgi:hypothetical protein